MCFYLKAFWLGLNAESRDQLLNWKWAPQTAGVSPFLQPCWLSLGKAGAPEGLQGSGSGLTQRAKRRSNATLAPVICTESKPQEQPFMGDKGNMGSSVNIQEQSKSPRSRACSRYPFHLFRAHWPPTAHVQCHLSCTKKSFQIQEMRCSSLRTKLPSCSPTGLFKISLPGTPQNGKKKPIH